MKPIKKGLLIVFCLLFSLSFSGCKGVISPPEELLQPPKLTKEHQQIQDTLKKMFGDYVLVYPSKGYNKSAIYMEDLDQDGLEEAIAFYQKAGTNQQVNVCVLKQKEDKWVEFSDEIIGASAVERVEFEDLTGDGRAELLVGWIDSSDSNSGKTLDVYSFDGVRYMNSYNSAYSQWLLFDFDEDGVKELVNVYSSNSEEKLAYAKYIDQESGKLYERSACAMDPGVVDYLSMQVSSVGSGGYGVYVDGLKSGKSVVTEVLVWDKSEGMKNPLFNTETQSVTQTLRSVEVRCMDINNDGVVEIPILSPLSTELTSNAPPADITWIYQWCTYVDGALIPAMNCLMNFSEGYCFVYPPQWSGKVTVKRDTEENTWHFVVLEEDREVATLLSIRKFTSEQWADPDIRGVYFILVGKEHINGTVYGAKIHRVDEAYAPLKLDIETVRQYFKLLDLNTK